MPGQTDLQTHETEDGLLAKQEEVAGRTPSAWSLKSY